VSAGKNSVKNWVFWDECPALAASVPHWFCILDICCIS